MRRPITNYQFLDENSKIVVEFINRGIMKIDVVKHLEIYEAFHRLTGTKEERYKKLAEQFDLSPSSIKKYVLKMQRRGK